MWRRLFIHGASFGGGWGAQRVNRAFCRVTGYEAGETANYVASYVELTEVTAARARAEVLAQELSELIETINVPLFGIDNRGRVDRWNRTAVELTDYSKHEVLNRQLIALLIPESQRESVSARWLRVLPTS